MAERAEREQQEGYVLPLAWSVALGMYVDAVGRRVPEAVLRQVLGVVMADSAARVAILTERLTAGELELLAWRTAMRAELQTSYGLAATLARGGLDRMDDTAWATLQGELRTAAGFLDQFGAQVAAGQVSAEQAAARAQMYAGRAHSVYEQFRRSDAQQRGVQQERNILQPGDNCAECLAATDAGWVPIGVLPPPGDRTCLSNCRCTLEYAAAPVEV